MWTILTDHATFLVGETDRGYTLTCLTDDTRGLFPTYETAKEFAEKYTPLKDHEMN